MRLSDPEFNRLSVLKTLRLAEPVSRTDLARLTRLNGGTITGIVRDLAQRGLLIEERVASDGMGRPKLNLRINPEGAFVVGATLTTDGRLIAEIVNLRGESVFTCSEYIRPTSRLTNLADQFVEIVTRTIDESPIAVRISQIGIGLPAIIDYNKGIVEFLETFGDKSFAFAEWVERRIGIPTKIDNNINLLTRAEHWFGDGAGADDFSIVLVDLGIGAASYQSGQLHISSHGIEAELGHVKIVPEDGRLCQCGARGCLQSYSSISGIVEQYCDWAGEPVPKIFEMTDMCERLAVRAQEGADDIIALFRRAGRYLGTSIANHINMQGPERIIILFGTESLSALMRESVIEALRRDTLPVLRDHIEVRFGRLDEGRYVRGAAAMVLEDLYQVR